MLGNLNLATKMLLSFGLMAACSLLIGGLGVYSSTHLSQALHHIGKNRVVDLKSLADLNHQRMVVRTQTLEVSEPTSEGLDEFDGHGRDNDIWSYC